MKKKGKPSKQGIEKAIEVAKQLHYKKGPYYEKWKLQWEARTGMKLKE